MIFEFCRVYLVSNPAPVGTWISPSEPLPLPYATVLKYDVVLPLALLVRTSLPNPQTERPRPSCSLRAMCHLPAGSKGPRVVPAETHVHILGGPTDFATSPSCPQSSNKFSSRQLSSWSAGLGFCGVRSGLFLKKNWKTPPPMDGGTQGRTPPLPQMAQFFQNSSHGVPHWAGWGGGGSGFERGAGWGLNLFPLVLMAFPPPVPVGATACPDAQLRGVRPLLLPGGAGLPGHRAAAHPAGLRHFSLPEVSPMNLGGLDTAHV